MGKDSRACARRGCTLLRKDGSFLCTEHSAVCAIPECATEKAGTTHFCETHLKALIAAAHVAG